MPTINETLICFGIWAFGLLLFTIFVRITIPVVSGRLTHDTEYRFTTERSDHASAESSAAEDQPVSADPV